MRWTVRTLDVPTDLPAVGLIDTSFSTDRIYRVSVRTDGFLLQSEDVRPPVTKRFPLDDVASGSHKWATADVAILDEGIICGFAASEYQEWNRRLMLTHLYVSKLQRRRGVARALVERVVESGEKLGAKSIWLETSNINHPAIAAYRALGFVLCGVDTSLYLGTSAADEVAIFMARTL